MNRTQFLSSAAAQAIIRYQAKYRHPDQPASEVGNVVHLFSNVQANSKIEGVSSWNDDWPFRDRAGVYLIYAEDHQLLYVGKTSMGQSLGIRLYTYFGDGEQCVINPSKLRIPPSFVVNIAMPCESRFEAPAVEEFLIAELSPKLNVQGI